MSADPPQPPLVEVLRNDCVESIHCGAVAVVRADGETIYSIGDIHRPVFVRSAIKPLQAVPLLESGALQAFGLDDRQLALACASHNGEAAHVEAVAAWLRQLGLACEALECGAEWPYSASAARDLATRGESPARWHHNCSGKHTGMLSCCLQLGLPTAGYTAATHPLHAHWRTVLEELAGLALAGLPMGTDGCGLPAPALPLYALALAYARLADPAALSTTRAASLTRIRNAMIQHAFLVAGTGRCCTQLLADQRILVKMGAEGVYVAALPQAGLGVALKIADGATRAAEVALCTVLEAAGLSPPAQLQYPVLYNSRGAATGSLRPAWQPPVLQ